MLRMFSFCGFILMLIVLYSTFVACHRDFEFCIFGSLVEVMAYFIGTKNKFPRKGAKM